MSTTNPSRPQILPSEQLTDNSTIYKVHPTEKTRAIYNEVSRNRIRKGLCPRCGSTPDPGRRTCPACIERATKKVRERREAVIIQSGPVCQCCGETGLAFLVLSKRSAQVLCHNCNIATKRGKICPHQLL